MIGCSPVLTPPTVKIKGTPVVHCYGFKAIHPTANDVMVISERLASQLLSHNDYGAKIKCWKKPR